MQRDKWTFDMRADELQKAAEAKREFHAGRLEFWKGKQDEVMKAVKDNGLSIQESAAGSNYSTKGAYAPEIVVDVTYQRDLNESSAKIKEHHARVGEYDGWSQVLASNAGRTYALNSDDYLFFFGK